MKSIEVQDLVFARKRARGQPSWQLGPLSLSLPAGSRTALIGPSGCGKTSLLRCLAGLEEPDAGTLRFGEQLVFDSETCLAPDKREIGFVFQDAALWPHKTALGQLRFVAPQLKRKQARALLAQVGLEGKEKRRPAQLSGGERQRLALARALAGEPQLLLLDEPLASVDVHLRDELALLVRRIAEERSLTLLLVTHDRDEALAMADEIVILRDGSLVEEGAAGELLRNPQTSFAASFLCRATSWPVVADGASLVTPFGTFAKRPESQGPMALVILPGEAQVVTEPVVMGEAVTGEAGLERASAQGRVLRVLPHARDWMASVEVAGRTLEARCKAGLRVGQEVSLRLEAAPRFLPVDRQSAEEPS